MTNKCTCLKIKKFTITEDHLKLLKRMYVGWQDSEYGAPEIDPKRPYGNSSVAIDIYEILGWEINTDEEISNSLREKCFSIHKETQMVLQILLQSGTFDILGNYKNCSCSNYHWVKDDYNEKLRERYEEAKKKYQYAFILYGSELAGFPSLEEYKNKRKES